jgi:hypothetical protein
MELEAAFFAAVGDFYQHPNRRPAQMRAALRVAAAALMSGIKTELHRHSPKWNNKQLKKLALSRYANLTQTNESGLNCYRIIENFASEDF